jgi:hypothetical protein
VRGSSFVLVSALVAGCTDSPSPLPADVTVAGKCVFAEGTRSEIVAGDRFVYVVIDRGGALDVVTDVAALDDALTDDVPRQAGELLPARLLDTRLEFGGLDAERAGEADHFVSMQDRTGAVHISIGTTYGTELAYPRCAFWAP